MQLVLVPLEEVLFSVQSRDVDFPAAKLSFEEK